MEVEVSELAQIVAHATGICSYMGSCVDCGVGCKIFKVADFYAKVKKHRLKGGTEPKIPQCYFCEHLTSDAAYLPGGVDIGCKDYIKAEAIVKNGKCSKFKLYQPVSYFYKVLQNYITAQIYAKK